MRNVFQNQTRNSTVRNSFLTSLAILIMLVATPAIASVNSLTVKMNKSPATYNIGDSISISGTATPNASVSIKILDPSNTTKVESEGLVASDGNYSMEAIYTLKITDEPGTWKVNVYESSTNETAETTFEVVAVWERLETLEGQLANLQNETQTLESKVQTLKTSVDNLSSRLSAIESLTMVIYGAMVTAVIAAVISVVALTQYLQKRNIYRKLVGKTEKGKTRRR
jgi:hypothetical protein